MFRDLRSFRSIAFRAPEIPDLKGLLQLFPPDKLEVIEPPFVLDNSGIDVLHCYYLADREYSTKSIPYQHQVNNGQQLFYRHNIYLISLLIDRIPTYFVAVPFLSMAIDVYPLLREGSRGRGIHYKMFNLPKLVSTVRDNKNLEGKLKITKVRYKVDGDNLLDTIIFKGKEVPHSSTFKGVVDSVHKGGPTLTAEQVRLTYTAKESRFTFEVDQSGHCKFWLAKNAANMPNLLDIASFLSNEKLLDESASFPFMRSLCKESENPQDV